MIIIVKKTVALLLAMMLILTGICVSARELYSDVPEDDWAAPYIYNISDRGIVSGYGDGTFGRNNYVLRCEYAKMLAKIAEMEPDTSLVSPYSDVPRNEWYFPYVNTVSPYMTGFQTPDGVLYFDPEAAATREAVTVAMVKALGIDASYIDDPDAYLWERFSDWESIAPHSRPYVAAAVDKGIITGDMEGTFRPQSPIIRAEVVIILYKAFPDKNNVTPNVSMNEEAVNEKLTAFFLDVGQGDSCFIELPEGKTMLVDAGTKKSAPYITDFIKSLGYSTIDYVIATHPHADHIGGMVDVFEEFDVKNFYMPDEATTSKTYENMMTAVYNEGCDIIIASKGVKIMGIPYISAEFLAPCGFNYSNLNDCSAVLRLDFYDSSYLLSGDAEEYAEQEMLSFGANLDADVLKVGHHGSRTSTTDAYLFAVNPHIAIISCGLDNSYGHPHSETLNKLEAFGSSVYRTDLVGTVCVSSHGEDITNVNVSFN